MAAACILSGVCTWAGLIGTHSFWIVAGSAISGMFLDSLLGATLERKGLIGNDSVNFAGTSFAAGLASMFWLLR
jgi:uncharacterized membrane protein